MLFRICNSKQWKVANPNSYFDPEEITKILKITPHSTTTMDKKRPIAEGTYPFSTWSGYKKEEPALDATLQVNAIVEELKEKISALLQIKRQYDVNLFITVVPSIYNEESPYIHFNKKIIDFCSQTNTEIGVHLYIYEKPIASK